MKTLRELHRQISNCKECEFFKEYWRFSSDAHGQCKSGIMVVGESSYKPSIDAGRYYAVGSLRSILENTLELDRECYLTDLVKCDKKYLKSKKYIEEAARNCSKYLYKEIEFINPIKIIAVGEQAFRFLTKLTGPFSGRQGDGNLYRYQSIPVIPIIHPSYGDYHYNKIVRQEMISYKDSVKNIFKKALNL